MGRLLVAVLALMTLADHPELLAQDMATRFGFGAGGVVNPSNRAVSPDDFGFDLRFRVSRPVSATTSLALDVGSFVFTQSEETEVVLNPQAMMIVTFGGENRVPYMLGGIGALLPAEQDRDSQLELHAGFGWAWPFGPRMSAFVEVNPLLAFRDEGMAGMVAARGGVIF